MPSLDEDLIDGFSLSEDRGRFTLQRVFFARDLVGASAVGRLASALALGGLPQKGDSIDVAGRTLYVVQRQLRASGQADAEVVVTYGESESAFAAAGLGPSTIEVSSTLRQTNTTFDRDERAKAFGSRQPITVTYQGATSLASVPMYEPAPLLEIHRDEANSPESRADAYVGRLNSATWRGYAAETVMCVGISGRNVGDGLWRVTYRFERDPTTRFRQVAAYRDALGRTPDDVTPGNGLEEIPVQPTADFNALAL